MKKTSLASAIAIAAYTSLSFAQESIEILITPLNSEQSAEQITADITLITAQEIAQKGYSTVIEALQGVPGLSLTQNGGPSATASIFLRGMDSGRTLVLMDGIRINDPTRTSGGIALENITMANVERIEIIKGPQSGIWGADATAGVINIISQKPTQGFKANLAIETGSFETQKISSHLSYATEKSGVAVSASYLESAGFSAQAPYGTDPRQLEADGYDNTHLAIKGFYHLSQQTKVAVDFDRVDAYSEIDGFTSYNTYEQDLTRLTLEQKIASNPLMAFIQQTDILRKDPESSWTPRFEGHISEAGLDYAFIKNAQSQLNAGLQTGKTEYDDFSYNSQSAFIKGSKQLDKTVVNAALRWDDFETYGDKTTFKLGIKHRFNEDWSIGSNLGTAFNTPTLYQRFGVYGNPTLTHETTQGLDAWIKWQGLKISLYQYDIQDMIDFSASTFQYLNVKGTSHSTGGEIGYEHDFGPASLSLNYAYTHQESPESNIDFLVRRAKETISVNTYWQAAERIAFNLNGLWTGQREKGHFDAAKGSENYWVWNGIMHYEISAQTRAYLKLNNLTNTYYQVIDGYATAPANYALGLNHQF
jgi:vitamin B12 transporter